MLGAVSIASRIDYDDQRLINSSYFIVRVKDNGEPQLSATASVSVIFQNINDNFPEFMDPVSIIDMVLHGPSECHRYGFTWTL